MEILAELHNKIVHFPIAIFVLYFVFELIGTVFNKDYLLRAAFILLITGTLCAVLSVLTGNQAMYLTLNSISKEHFLNQFIERHENYATFSLWYFTAIMFFRIYLMTKKKFVGQYQVIFVLLSFIGAVLILITAYTGGILVYDFGIGTKLFGK